MLFNDVAKVSTLALLYDAVLSADTVIASVLDDAAVFPVTTVAANVDSCDEAVIVFFKTVAVVFNTGVIEAIVAII